MAKQVSTFRMPSEYERAAMEARRRQRMAEMLAQQAYTPQDIGSAPIPSAAPLVQGLQAFLTARQQRKAEEALEKAEAADVEGYRKLREELGPRSQIAAPTNQQIAESVGMPQIAEDGTISYGQATMPKLGMEQVMPTAQERERALEDAFVAGTPRARKYAEFLMAKEPQSKLMEFGDQLLNVTGGTATPVTMGGKPVTAPKAVESAIGKPSPGDFTPASLAQFARTGNYADLVPVPRPAPVTNINMASEGERKDAYNLARVVSAARSINAATKAEPKAIKPGVKEATVAALPGVDEASYLAQSPQRQIVTAAQTDMIDALLTLATGAAYTKEQLAGQRAAILPRFGESKESIDAKRQRVRDLVTAARIRAGRAWTPEMDQAIETAFGPVEDEPITDLPPPPR
jgi:hypothetical protein